VLQVRYNGFTVVLCWVAGGESVWRSDSATGHGALSGHQSRCPGRDSSRRHSLLHTVFLHFKP